MAPRRTVVIGSLSDSPGDESRAYRKAGRAALGNADRVVFCGEKASRARKLKNSPEADRVILLYTFSELIEWLDLNLIEDEVVLLKSNSLNHLERAFLVPKYGKFCALDSCKHSPSCFRCKVTRGIEGMRDEAAVNNLLPGGV